MSGGDSVNDKKVFCKDCRYKSPYFILCRHIVMEVKYNKYTGKVEKDKVCTDIKESNSKGNCQFFEPPMTRWEAFKEHFS